MLRPCPRFVIADSAHERRITSNDKDNRHTDTNRHLYRPTSADISAYLPRRRQETAGSSPLLHYFIFGATPTGMQSRRCLCTNETLDSRVNEARRTPASVAFPSSRLGNRSRVEDGTDAREAYTTSIPRGVLRVSIFLFFLSLLDVRWTELSPGYLCGVAHSCFPTLGANQLRQTRTHAHCKRVHLRAKSTSRRRSKSGFAGSSSTVKRAAEGAKPSETRLYSAALLTALRTNTVSSVNISLGKRV